MKNFFENVFRYPRYLITFALGIFFSVFQWLRPRDRSSAIAMGIFVVSALVFVVLTLRAMLGLTIV